MPKKKEWLKWQSTNITAVQNRRFYLFVWSKTEKNIIATCHEEQTKIKFEYSSGLFPGITYTEALIPQIITVLMYNHYMMSNIIHSLPINWANFSDGTYIFILKDVSWRLYAGFLHKCLRGVSCGHCGYLV